MLVAQDAEGLKMAALEMFESSLFAPDLERQMENLAPGAGIEEIEKFARARHLSPGYEEFCAYLLWLESVIAVGVQMALNADEAEGLRALAAARNEFETKHPKCGHCGARQYSVSARTCRKCRKEF